MRKPAKRGCNRRQFLKRSAAAGGALAAAPYAITSTALGAEGKPPASDRITVGFIGLGGHGIGRNLNGFLGQKDAQPVALCDVDQGRVELGLKTCRGRLGEGFTCPTTQDWREVVARDDIDAVMISTADHWHVPLSLAALRAGKDVICEKPTFSIAEGRVLADTVKRYGAVFQTSTEDRSIPVYIRMASLVRNGRLGKLQKIYVQLPGGPGGPGDPKPKPVPEGLDWDMWLGPAPWKPYRDGLHMFHWRWNRDYSGGNLTDWGAHQLDTAQLACDTERTGPIAVEGAEPGSALKVDIVKIELTAGEGAIVAIPGRGAWAKRISQPSYKVVTYDSDYVYFNDRIKIPIRRMVGKVGVAPAAGKIKCDTSGSHGGNMDITDITDGASVYLPVYVRGGLSSAQRQLRYRCSQL